MKRRQTSSPQQWLIVRSDLSELPKAIRRLPRGSGVLIVEAERRGGGRKRLTPRARQLARTRDIQIRIETRRGVRRVHNVRELRRALLHRVPMILLSPIYPTRSHPDWTPISRMRAATLARLAGRRLVALGGMDARRFAQIQKLGFLGWAGIGAWERSGQR